MLARDCLSFGPEPMQRPLTKLQTPTYTGGDPVKNVVAAPEFQIAQEYFTDYPPTSLLYNGGVARAFIYLLIRSMSLKSLLEIGTFQAGTTEVIARALWANGIGHVDTVDPSGYPQITAALAEWAPELRALCSWHNQNSMAFFHAAQYLPNRYDLIFIDGDHEHFAALYDIQRSAALLNHGGFLLIDNAELPSVRVAALQFLSDNDGWELLGPREARTQNPIQSMANLVMSIPETGFWLMRAPSSFTIDTRPTCISLAPFDGTVVRGLQMRLAPGTTLPAHGAISYRTSLQAIGSFDKGLNPIEVVSCATTDISALERAGDLVTLRFERPIDYLASHPRASEYTVLVETCLNFMGDGRLELALLPQPV